MVGAATRLSTSFVAFFEKIRENFSIRKKVRLRCRSWPICSDFLVNETSHSPSKGANAMQFILMMTAKKSDWDAFMQWPKSDLQAHVAFMQKFSQELKNEGVFVATHGLAVPDQALVVRAGNKREPVTDGVFPESKEFLASFWIIDVENAEQAYKIAARASAAPGPGGVPARIPIEVREVMSTAPKEWL
jgi:hypothetical protein